MIELFSPDRYEYTDLNMYHCGMQECSSGHSYGPALRDHYLIHYIISGKGIYQVGDKVYHLEEGQGFLICPGIVTYYEADLEDPWHYCWVGFQGIKAKSCLEHAGLTMDHPIFGYTKDDYIKDCVIQMLEVKALSKGNEIMQLGLLHLLLARLINDRPRKENERSNDNRKELYTKKVIEFIEMNYSREISISSIAQYIGLDRSYLASVFKENMNISMQDF